MDLTPFLVNVGRIADALELIAARLGPQIDHEPEERSEAPEWLKTMLGETQVKLVPPVVLMPGVKMIAADPPVAAEPAAEASPAGEEPADEPAPAQDPLDATILEIYETGICTLNGVATELNNRGVTTARGSKFYASTLARMFDRLGLKSTGGSFKAVRAAAGKSGFAQSFGAPTFVRRRQLPPPPAGKTDQDLIDEAMAAGRVTKLPACVDSHGFNHETGENA